MPKALSPLPKERDFESFFGSPRPLGEGLGVRAKTTVLNVDLVYHCRRCDIYFSDTFATPMAGLRTPLSRIIEVLKARTEGQGLNATARIFGVSKRALLIGSGACRS